ncbi:hypothetical protein U8F20_004085 [Salmonella enterica]|nr:hypothetical protein [Salmonella enterica]
MHPQFLVWCLTFGAQFKNDGHYFCRAGGNRPDGLNEPVTSDLGEGKAKYWTLNIEEAHRFNSIDEATEQLCKLNRPHLIKIRKVEGVSE